jgi:hypothetical protein
VNPGELRYGETVHWEDPPLRALFCRGITPTDFDGWTGFTDLGGDRGGPLVIFELKHENSDPPGGQLRAFRQLRLHLPRSDWFVVVLHAGVDRHVWGRDITRWGAFRCGCDDRTPEEQGVGAEALAAFVLRLDPFGKPIGPLCCQKREAS